jgi:dTDP-4-dehydrorhamnose reductase
MKKIVITGGPGRFGSILKKIKSKNKLFFPDKKNLNIENFKNIKNYLSKNKPDILIHLAGLSRPMSIHDEDIKKSINLNIIGTANVTKACAKKNIKLIYFSTQYVYPGIRGNYKETDHLLPVNNYGWSKLGGESAVQMYKNSLILRICMTEKPFIHKSAFADVKTNFIFHDEIVPILNKILNKKGIINLGGPIKTVYEFAKKNNPNIKKIFAKKTHKGKFPLNPSMNLNKINKILKND